MLKKTPKNQIKIIYLSIINNPSNFNVLLLILAIIIQLNLGYYYNFPCTHNKYKNEKCEYIY